MAHAAGIAPEDMTIVEGETNRRGGMACLDAALALPDPPTAAVCFNDAVAFGAMLATAILDIVEDHHIIALLEDAEHSILPSARAITLQATLSMTKFSISYLALFMFGLAIPRTTRLGLALSLFLTAGTLVSAVIGYALPPMYQASFESGRWIGFLAGFVLAIAWLIKSPDATPSSPAP